MASNSPAKSSRLTLFNTGLLLFQGLIGAYLYIVPDQKSFVLTQALVLVHVVTCLLWLPIFLWWVGAHLWARLSGARLLRAFRSVGGSLGLLLLVAVVFGFGSGLPLLGKGADMPLASFHAMTGLLVLLPFGVHLWLEHRRVLFLTVAVLCGLGAISLVTVKETVAGDSVHPKTPEFKYRDQPMEAYDSAAWCGSCHNEVYAEWNASTHRRSIKLDIVRKGYRDETAKEPREATITMGGYGEMLAGTEDVFKSLPTKDPFLACSACHAPLGFYAGVPKSPIDQAGPVSDGIACAFCHTTRGLAGGKMNLAPVFAKLREQGQLDNHALMLEVPFYNSAPTTVRRYLWQNDADPLRRWVGDLLIRWRPQMHAHDYHPDFLNTSLLCHGCHGFQGTTKVAPGRSYDTWYNSAYNSPNDAKRTECQDCHMARRPDGHPVREPGKLVPWAPDRPQRRYHYFLGGNVSAADPTDTNYIHEQRVLRLKGLEFTMPSARMENGQLVVDVSLHNRLNAHFFPAYETKRRWAWVDLRVLDGDGEEIARSKPGPDNNKQVQQCCRENMDPIVYYRVVTERMEILADTLVPADGTRVDTARLQLPPNPKLPLQVIATLRHNSDAKPVVTVERTVH